MMQSNLFINWLRINTKINKINGFTFIQLMVAIGIAGIMLAAAIPSFNLMMNNARLERASENFASYLMFAKSKANNGDTVYLAISAGTNWCYGLNSTAGCSCATSGSCGYLEVDSSKYQGVTMTNSSGISQLLFTGNSGAISSTLQITFTNSDNKSITVIKNKVGTVTVCSNDISHYSGC